MNCPCRLTYTVREGDEIYEGAVIACTRAGDNHRYHAGECQCWLFTGPHATYSDQCEHCEGSGEIAWSWNDMTEHDQNVARRSWGPQYDAHVVARIDDEGREPEECESCSRMFHRSTDEATGDDGIDFTPCSETSTCARCCEESSRSARGAGYAMHMATRHLDRETAQRVLRGEYVSRDEMIDSIK